MKRLLIEFKENKPDEWVKMFALLDYIRDMDLTFVCKDSINNQHMLYDDENKPMMVDCRCIHPTRKKLIRRAWYELKQLYNGDSLIHLKFWLKDYLMLNEDIYYNIYNRLS